MIPGCPRTVHDRRRGSAYRWALLACCCLAASTASCTELMLAPYRDDASVENHHYALGERYLEVNGMRLCYVEQGRGDNVIILPGLGTSIEFWQLNVPKLAENYHVVALDPPGSGLSDKPDASYDLLWICDQVLAFMDAKDMPRASFVGGSMGGHLALLIALRHPERVDKLVLMGSSGAWPRPGILLTAALVVLWNDAVVTDHMRRTWPDTYGKIFAQQTPMTRDLLRYQMAVRADGRRFAPEGRALSRSLQSIFWHSCRDELGRLKQPTLLIWGEGDRIHLRDEAICFRDSVPDSRLVVVPGAAHEVMVDQPETFNRLVLTFLKEGTSAVADNPQRGENGQVANSGAAK